MPLSSSPNQNALTDIVGLRLCGIFPQGKEPSIRTLREWTKLRRIPHHRLGHFVYYDPTEVAVHIRTKLKLQFGTDYLSHFALTGWVLPLLVEAKGRIVELSSIAHRSGRIRLDDLNTEHGYKPFPVYGQSKLAMLVFALELNRRSHVNHWGLTSVAAHPGLARTDLVDNGPGVGANAMLTSIIKSVLGMLGHSAAAGALPILMAATRPSAKGGQYFGPQGWKELKGQPGPGKIDRHALDLDLASKLWAASERMTGVRFDF